MRAFILLLALILIVGCATTPPPEPVEPSPEMATLVQRADQYRQQGRYDQAEAVLEQALRIDARNPRTWYELASLRLDEGRLENAEAMAMKSLRYSDETSRESVQSWLLVAEIKRRKGDAAGADQAMARARNIAGRLR